MFNIDAMVKPYIEQLKPHFISAKQTAEIYGERILERLDRINDSVSNEEFDEHRPRYNGTIDTTAIRIFEVPPGDEIVIEAISVLGTGSLVLRDKDSGGSLLAALNITTADTRALPPIHIRGGTQVWAIASGPLECYFQFKRKRKRASRTAYTAGQPSVAVEGTYNDEQFTARHTGEGELNLLVP